MKLSVSVPDELWAEVGSNASASETVQRALRLLVKEQDEAEVRLRTGGLGEVPDGLEDRASAARGEAWWWYYVAAEAAMSLQLVVLDAMPTGKPLVDTLVELARGASTEGRPVEEQLRAVIRESFAADRDQTALDGLGVLHPNAPEPTFVSGLAMRWLARGLEDVRSAMLIAVEEADHGDSTTSGFPTTGTSSEESAVSSQRLTGAVDEVSIPVLHRVVAEMPRRFGTRDVSEHQLCWTAHGAMTSHSHYHARIGRALSKASSELGIVKDRRSGGQQIWKKVNG